MNRQALALALANCGCHAIAHSPWARAVLGTDPDGACGHALLTAPAGFRSWRLGYTRLTMRRLPVLLLILIAMLWQSVAMARIGSTVNALADMEHAALHWQAESHHHHEDGSYHLDDSNESAQHVAIDHLSATLAMTAPSSHDFPPLGSAAPGGLYGTPVPNPTLEGLLRPPRPRA